MTSNATITLDQELDTLLDDLDSGRLGPTSESTVAPPGEVSTDSPGELAQNCRPSSSMRSVPATATGLATVMRTGKTALPLDWPDLSNLYAAESNDELLDTLAEQVTRISKGACFEDERAQYRAIHLALNRRLVTPPRFRAPIRGRKPDGKSFTMAEQALTNDKQVIDLDWLHCAGKRDTIPENGLGSLFSSDARIDWDMAEQLAKKLWRSDTKVIESLRLSDAEQFPLAMLQTRKIGVRWAEIQKRQAKIETALKNRAERYPTLSSAIPSLVAVWKADKMAADASLRTKARLHQWIVGSSTPMAPEQFREQLRRVRGHLEH